MNKMNNKGFSLVELIVVIAIMAVLMGVLAPTLIGNIEKSRESKDLQAIEGVYQAVNHALATEAGAKEAAKTAVKDMTLANLLASESHTALAAEIKEELGSAEIDLSAACNASASIYISVDSSSLKAYVYCAGEDKKVTECTKTKDSAGAFKKMEVGVKPAAAATPEGSEAE